MEIVFVLALVALILFAIESVGVATSPINLLALGLAFLSGSWVMFIVETGL